jgi:hypothetical protein
MQSLTWSGAKLVNQRWQAHSQRKLNVDVKSYHPKLAMQKSSTEQRADQKHEGNN